MERDFKQFFDSFATEVQVKKGGGRHYTLFNGSGGDPSLTLPAATLDGPAANMSSSMATHFAQPLTAYIPETNVMEFPADMYGHFNPLLTNGAAGGGRRCKNKKLV